MTTVRAGQCYGLEARQGEWIQMQTQMEALIDVLLSFIYRLWFNKHKLWIMAQVWAVNKQP